ncbi:TPA: pyruvate kinase [Candidatus Woesearchaeota archaeon]|nr:pyruvate kinase [Candidatus Woesearchaeota archaeon]HIH31411.1 pyruvate kinase [Candidatus Woesearchaeota archaeon]HIH55176.1 pyruvate kinase [Candidatus Woesearchaeota archaeon]HIJ14104.1 pyruvate kinase [Candidatus Woesearchaeota archaeon]
MEKYFRDRKTKIICTIGPSSDTEEMIAKMQERGMNIARLNFSHGTHEDHGKIMDLLHKINENLEVPIGVMLDTKGPEIRIGKFKEPTILKDDSEIILTTENIEWSDNKIISISYKNLPKIVEKGSLIYIADGTIELRVDEVKGREIRCRVSIGGEVNTRKNVNIPGAIVDLPAISDEDISDIEFGIEKKIDFIAQSFVKTAEDVLAVREILRRNNAGHIHIIAKIESFQAMENLDRIVDAADGIMVARGDLGVQIPIENIPNAQKSIIKKCNIAGKPVITATQMLESMTKNPKPTRAEATDVANAILDGSDAIMLSGETASGKYPLRALDIMDKIARKTEQILKTTKIASWVEEDSEYKSTITDSLSKSVCSTAKDLEASAIITCTSTGHTARQISRHRPLIPIYAVTPNEHEFRKLVLTWGVYPVLIDYPEDTDDLMEKSLDIIKSKKFVKEFDLVVITAGIPFNISGNINTMKVELIK